MRHARDLKRTILIVVLALVISVSGQPLSTLAQPDEFSYRIDPSIEPALVELPGLSGGPVRLLAAVQLPDGTQEDFVVNEVILSTTGQSATRQAASGRVCHD